jgi:hypothetical protein
MAKYYYSHIITLVDSKNPDITLALFPVTGSKYEAYRKTEKYINLAQLLQADFIVAEFDTNSFEEKK